jgi:hypothetical protein
MLTTYENTNKQGNAGIGIAIAWFTSNGYTVSVPLTDTQDYDLIVDNNKPARVQIKTTTYQRRDVYYVSLTVKGGNRSGTGKIKKFNASNVDFVFIVTGNDTKYLIPSTAIATQSSITLSTKYDLYKI